MTPPCDVLITYGWVRSTYTALRSLNRLGLRVGVADTGRSGMCQGSRLGTWAGTYADPLVAPERFIEDINSLLRQTGAHFLLPGHDETEVLARYRHRLPAGVILPVAEVRKIEYANDKARAAGLAGECGLPVPRRLTWSTLEELEVEAAAIGRPLVVKLRRGNSAKGVFYPPSPEKTAALCASLIERYRLQPGRFPIVQERVSGDGWGVSCLYWQGRRLASFTHHRLREKTGTGGTSTLRISERNQPLEKMAYTLLDKLEWHGLAMVEFKFDSPSRKGWFIEINPRLWGSIHLAVASGVDFPALLYAAATEGPEAVRKKAPVQREGIVARWYLGDLIASLGLLRHGRVRAALQAIWPMGTADTLDDVFRDDPGAFRGEIAYYLSTFLSTRSLNPEREGMLG